MVTGEIIGRHESNYAKHVSSIGENSRKKARSEIKGFGATVWYGSLTSRQRRCAAAQKPIASCRRQEGRKPKTPRFLALARPLSGILPLG